MQQQANWKQENRCFVHFLKVIESEGQGREGAAYAPKRDMTGGGKNPLSYLPADHPDVAKKKN